MSKTAYRWIIIFVVLLLFIDFFYQVIHSNVPFWSTDWFWWRVMFILLMAAFVLTYYMFMYFKKAEIEKYNFIKNLIEQQDIGYRKIAAELHDGLGQDLIVLNNKVLQISNSHPENVDLAIDLKDLSVLISDSVEEVRQISSGLYPHQIEKLGLSRALESMLDKAFRSSNINADIVIGNVDNLLNINNEINFYRIIQECINNILKHSEATDAVIKIKCSVGEIISEIRDNGIGFQFDNKSIKNITGFGLSNIKHRVLLAGGYFNIDTKTGKGTKINIRLPIKD
jgi:signal transduction histidine kinase